MGTRGDEGGQADEEQAKQIGVAGDDGGVCALPSFEGKQHAEVEQGRQAECDGGYDQRAVGRDRTVQARLDQSVGAAAPEVQHGDRIADEQHDKCCIDEGRRKQDDRGHHQRRQGVKPTQATVREVVALEQGAETEQHQRRQAACQDRLDIARRLDMIAPAQTDDDRLHGAERDKDKEGRIAAGGFAGTQSGDEQDDQQQGGDEGQGHEDQGLTHRRR